ncbi:carbamoyltransferase [Actinomycetospora sp. NBRC 106375]|uniref:carbamoyltransferase HypF n=1 Tax=Actinomycetospora sp. NBRC 106375 TaxID=3032207 RepID=UPI0024A34F4A|nr:carbamoyltransferase HypF [Actinomycetospora sp. NBRC 106375]GLZ44159.1 carbamoyltransferase [Actinomycetospora sp. NBRC 106375]
MSCHDGEVCLTCSDEALPFPVVAVDGDLARVDTGAGTEEISIALVDAAVGDVVLVHAGEAIARLDDAATRSSTSGTSRNGPGGGPGGRPGVMLAADTVRARLVVTGIVQGVGFRPFVHRMAAELGLAGFVGNDASGVVVEVEGPPAAVDVLTAALRDRAPALAVVEAVAREDRPPTGRPGFVIAASDPAAGGPRTLVSPDTAPCADCLAELGDPGDRRYRHPFVNCTNCGPRLSIVCDVPYDRMTTTMAGFAMCAACAAEYHDPTDRRFHAQPVCCPDCGPTLRLDGASHGTSDGALARAVARLAAGEILAVKGLGGYHLAVRADDETAVARLRASKHREDKPFALLAADLDAAERLVRTDAVTRAVLGGARRPIVLRPRRAGAAVAPSVAPCTRELGVMLPATPLHHLLAADLGYPLVLTSGNVSDEPIAHRDDDAATRLAPIADGILTHDRAIRTRVDDSVVRTARGRVLPVRRARGYAPEPVPLGFAVGRPVLACGGEQKVTIALASGRRAFVSSHVGDLENLATLRAFTDAISHLGRLFAITPEVVVHDLHPQYRSTAYALERDDLEPVGVQHHHAHVAACLAEHGWGPDDGPVLGVAFDGTGWGPDGTVWGGELLLASLRGARRVGHLRTVGLPGGAAAVRAPWRMAAAWVDALGLDARGLAVAARHRAEWDPVVALARAPSTLATSSAGRLFDAVAALAGVRDTTSYEGQAAVELEQWVDPEERAGYPVPAARDGVLAVDALVAAVVEDVRGGIDAGRIAARFHHGLADATVAAVAAAAAEHGVETAALSGGVFVNLVLLERVRAGLEAAGLRVLVHERVPCTDGGISLGQAVVGASGDTGEVVS